MSLVNTSNSKSSFQEIDAIEPRKKLLIIHPRLLKVLQASTIDSPLMQVKDEFQPVSGELKKIAKNTQ